jgi:signal transduction histidine kinase
VTEPRRHPLTRVWIHVGVGVGLLLVAATGSVTYRTARASAASAAWALHTHEVHAAIDGLAAQVAAAESARRGFIITADPGMAGDFQRAAAEVPVKWRQVREQLGADNASQQRRLDELIPRLERRLERLTASVAAAESGRGDIDQKALTIQGRAESAAMRALLDDMLADEDHLLRERSDGTSGEARRVIAYVTGAVLLSVLLLATSHVLLAREMGRREAADRALQDANRELEAFSYSVSHDLRTPLRGIDGFSQALVEDAGPALPPEARRHIERIRNATQRMGHLIDDILALSKVSRVDMKPERVDLSDLAAQVVADLRRQSPSREVTVTIAPDLSATGDPRLLRVALENLLDNAWKFTGRRDHATIEVGQAHDGVVPAFYVRDNGAGFDPAYADKLFGPFQRLHAASEFPGTGVGLATVQRIVRRHGGRVWAEGKPEQGACFYFTLD